MIPEMQESEGVKGVILENLPLTLTYHHSRM